MCLIVAMKVALCLVDIIDDNISENRCVSNSSLTKTVSSSNLSQHILTMITETKTDSVQRKW